MKGILFVRAQSRLFNLGDLLCTPRYYFDFGVPFEAENKRLMPLKDYITIFGGGAWEDFGQKASGIQFESTVAWGIGSSLHGLDTVPEKACDLPYKLAGLRDLESVTDGVDFVPCVSCLHPMLEKPLGEKTFIFLNRDNKATGDSERLVARGLNTDLVYNDTNEFRFVQVLTGSKKIITNSYHGAYWGLLAGRQVHILGYSSKLRSLAKIFGVPTDCISYYDSKNASEQLAPVLKEVLREKKFFGLSDPTDKRKEFRNIQISFATKVADIFDLARPRVRTHNQIAVAIRNLTGKTQSYIKSAVYP